MVLKSNDALSDASRGFAAGLSPKWIGPFIVAEKLSQLNYKLRNPNTAGLSGPVHVGELKKYFQRKVTAEKKAHTTRIRGERALTPTHSYNTRSKRKRY